MVSRMSRSSLSSPSWSTWNRSRAARQISRVIDALVAHLGEVAHAAQQAVGDPRRAARTGRELGRRLVVDGDPENAGRAAHDRGELVFGVVLEPLPHAEAVAQRGREQAGARGRADQREGRHREADAARRRTFADHDVDLEVLHRRVEHLFDGRVEPVDLVDEQHVALLQVGEDAGHVDLALEGRAGGGVDADLHLGGDDAGEGRLAQSGRPGEQHVVEGLAAVAGRLDEDLELFLDAGLAHEVGELLGPQRLVEVAFVGQLDGIGDAPRLVGHVRHDAPFLVSA